MRQTLKSCFVLLAFAVFAFPAWAQPADQSTEKRVALVIGNANYQAKPLQTPANDGGLIAQTLQAAGFDVSGARDLDEDSLRHAVRDFVEKVSASGPNTVAFVYFGGYGVQLEGENYLVPVDVGRDADAPSRSVRVADFLRPLSALQLKLGMIVLDAARLSPFSVSGQTLAGGLALLEPVPNMMAAFNAAPGTAAPDEKGPYGAYAQALAEMMREGGLSPGEVFERVRLRVNEATKGAQVPWNSVAPETSFVFFQRAADAPRPPAPVEQTAAVRSKPIRSLGPKDGYLAAVRRDTLPAYEEFVAAYPSDAMAKRVRALAAARREAIIWRRTRIADTPNAYWTYLRRYPHGPHAWDARRRLAEIAAALEPPPYFDPIDYDVPPPPPEEIIYIDRPVLIFDDPEFGFAPPPPPPIYFLPPPPPDFVVLPPPVVFVEPFILPIPAFVPIPVFVNPPSDVLPPANNIVFNNIHNTIVVNNATNVVTVKNQSGQVVSTAPLKATAPGAPTVPAVGASLPPFVAQKAAQTAPAQPCAPPQAAPGTAPGAAPGAPGRAPGILPVPVPVPIPGKGQPALGVPGQAPPPAPATPGAPPTAAPALPAPGVKPPAGGAPPPTAAPAPSPPATTAPSPPGDHKLPTPPAPAKPGGTPPTAAPAAKPPPPVDVAPPPVRQAPPPVHVAPPPVRQAPPPVDVAPPPVRQAPPPVDVAPP
ncbi:MAG: caspase family protein, partial [Methylocystis sp.]|nr:caspase family protein [Methylocystis sp.]